VSLVVGFFGGSFNPPHVAHVLACTLLRSVEGVDRVLVVPTFQHPFAKALAPYEDRVRMCELAMAWLPGVEVSRIEETLGGESRTLRTIEHLASAHGDWILRLVIGADVLAEAPRWHGFDAITKIAPPIILGRAGTSATSAVTQSATLPDVSSTRVRDAIARSSWSEVEPVVPRAVLAYIRERGLYAAPA
jgi:nicotinate-nucleotide adenylyltransferase